jgi:hypothetical protein
MFIKKISLARRTFLRGIGAAVGLPLLDAMVPAFTAIAQTAANPPPRFGAVFVPNGAIMDQWIPSAPGTGFELSPILKPLERFQSSLVVVSNLTRAPGVVEGDHAISASGWLTGYRNARSGRHSRARPSTVIAKQIGQDTPSRRSSCDDGYTGASGPAPAASVAPTRT